jgi:hypothetical protein
MKNIICAILGHDDPVMMGIGFVSQEDLYTHWKDWNRDCNRCGTPINPSLTD